MADLCLTCVFFGVFLLYSRNIVNARIFESKFQGDREENMGRLNANQLHAGDISAKYMRAKTINADYIKAKDVRAVSVIIGRRNRKKFIDADLVEFSNRNKLTKPTDFNQLQNANHLYTKTEDADHDVAFSKSKLTNQANERADKVHSKPFEFSKRGSRTRKRKSKKRTNGKSVSLNATMNITESNDQFENINRRRVSPSNNANTIGDKDERGNIVQKVMNPLSTPQHEEPLNNVPSGLDNKTQSGIDSIPQTGIDNKAQTRLDNKAKSGLDNIAQTGLDNKAQRELDKSVPVVSLINVYVPTTPPGFIQRKSFRKQESEGRQIPFPTLKETHVDEILKTRYMPKFDMVQFLGLSDDYIKSLTVDKRMVKKSSTN